MASFQEKMERERLRMWEKKIIIQIHFNPTRNTEFQKNSKEIQKIKKHGMGREWEKKTYRSYRFLANPK